MSLVRVVNKGVVSVGCGLRLSVGFTVLPKFVSSNLYSGTNYLIHHYNTSKPNILCCYNVCTVSISSVKLTSKKLSNIFLSATCLE